MADKSCKKPSNGSLGQDWPRREERKILSYIFKRTDIPTLPFFFLFVANQASYQGYIQIGIMEM